MNVDMSTLYKKVKSITSYDKYSRRVYRTNSQDFDLAEHVKTQEFYAYMAWVVTTVRDFRI